MSDARLWAAAIASVVAAIARPAAAQQTLIQADGSVNVGYTQTTRATFQADPDAEPTDVPDASTGGLFTELRPGISIQGGSPRLTWRAGYVFSGNLSFTGDDLAAYSNQGNVALAAEPTRSTQLTVSAALAQGGTSFLLSQRAADAGQPELRAPGNPAMISGTLVESITWAAGRHLSLQHSLIASLSAPEDALEERNSAVTANLALDRAYARDTLGLELRTSVSWLRPLRMDLEPYQSFTSSVLARWNHDFTASWNGFATAGIEQVFTDTGSRPLAFLPTASVSARYAAGDLGAALELVHATATNLQVGSVSLTDRISARGNLAIDPRKLRSVAFSAGFLHNEPLGEVDALVAAGTGNAVQGDAGFTTGIARNVVASARYSVAYQFGQGGGLGSTLAHIFLLGVTASYRNTEDRVRPLPVRGQRVDGTDAVGFPVVEDGPAP